MSHTQIKVTIGVTFVVLLFLVQVGVTHMYSQWWIGDCVGMNTATDTPEGVRAKKARCAELWEARQ